MHQILYSALEFRKEHQLLIKLAQEIKAVGTPEAKEAIDRMEDALKKQM